MQQRRRQLQLQQEREQRLARNHNVRRDEEPPASANMPQPPQQQQQPENQPLPDQDPGQQDKNTPSQRDPPVVKINDLSRNNKGKWFQVKFQGLTGYQWRLEGHVDLPQDLLEEILERKTWAGTARKRRKKH